MKGCNPHNVACAFKELGRKLLALIEEKIGALGPENAFVATNAKFLTSRGYSVAPVMTAFLEKGLELYYNVVPVHSPYYADLHLVAYNKDSSKGVYARVARSAVEKIAACDRATADYIKWEPLSPGGAEGWSDKARYLTILAAWLSGASHELLLGAELHNHVCPGLISGYLIIRRLEELGLLKQGVEIKLVSAPPWCKDDLLIQVLDATPGKRNFSVKFLTEDRRQELRRSLGGDPAYIAFIHDRGREEVLVISFDWEKAREIAGVVGDTPSSKLAMSAALLRHLDEAAQLIHVKHVEAGDPELFKKASLSGTDPYKTVLLHE